jgi:Raf kinase inhibitor-like YbhB/YbcL family protein
MAGGFYHWVVYNLPASTHSLDGDVKLAADQLGETSLHTTGYHGPCPPSGPAHHYVFTVYALDVPRIGAGSPPSGPDLERLMAGHIVASGVFEGTFSR